MMDCPKCGFTQPEDKYCANCGVNVVNFRNKPINLQTRLLNNPWTYFFVLSLTTTGLLIFISLQPESQIARTAKKWILEPNSDQILTNTDSQILNESEESPEEITASSLNTLDNETQEDSKDIEVIPSTNEVNTGKKLETNEVAVEQKSKGYQVRFVEFARNKMENILRASQVLSESQELLAVTIKTDKYVEQLKKFDSEMNLLPGQYEALIGKSEKPLNFLVTDDSGDDFGMSLMVRVKEVDKKSHSIDFDIFINLKLQDRETSKFQFNHEASFTIDSSTTLLLSVALPRQKLITEHQELLSNSPLKILESADYLSLDRPTEWLIVIEPL